MVNGECDPAIRRIDPPCGCRTVVLEHRLADGSSHFDWLLALTPPPSPEARCVRTWRLDGRPDQLAPGGRLVATRLEDHRALYLHHEGRVSPDSDAVHEIDRGTVTRLAIGRATVEFIDGTSMRLDVEWRDRDASGAISGMRLMITDSGDGTAGVIRLDRSGPEFPRRLA